MGGGGPALACRLVAFRNGTTAQASPGLPRFVGWDAEQRWQGSDDGGGGRGRGGGRGGRGGGTAAVKERVLLSKASRCCRADSGKDTSSGL